MIDTLLLEWYSKEKRDLPWRKRSSPYAIWISEIMLQQTRVEQVIHYFNRFMDAFPDIQTLALAPEGKVLKLWQGLGYYSRARNIHKTARIIQDQYHLKFPVHYNDIISLPGIGPYTAGAIASIAYNHPVSAIDGNVQRVIARLFEIDEPVNTPAGNRIIRGITDDLLPAESAGNFNQALMDLGATICKPRSPRCDSCPVMEHCRAFKNSRTGELPIKKKNTKSRNRYFNYFIVINQNTGGTFFTQRNNPNDIWYHLYEFPMIETDQETDPDRLLKMADENYQMDSKNLILRQVTEKTVHILSHQKIVSKCLIFETDCISVPFSDKSITYVKKTDKYPTHALTTKIILNNPFLKKNLTPGG